MILTLLPKKELLALNLPPSRLS